MSVVKSITLDGVEFISSVTEGIDEFSVGFALDNGDEGATQLTVSNKLTFIKDGFRYIKEKLIDNTNPCDEEIEVIIKLDCCNEQTYTFTADYKSIEDFCLYECQTALVLAISTPELDAVECLESTLIHSDEFLEQATHVSFSAANASATRGAGAILYAILDLVFGAINTIINLIDSIPGININEIGNGLLDDLIGFNKVAQGFVLKDMLEWHAINCGLDGFYSDTTLTKNDLYACTVHIPPQFEQIGEDCETFNIGNRSSQTVADVLDSLANVYDAEWRVQNNQLHLQTSNTFKNDSRFKTVIADIVDLEILEETPFCVRYATTQEQDQCNILEITYTNDPLNNLSNEMLSRYRTFEDIRQTGSGVCTSTIPFAAPHFYGNKAISPVDTVDGSGAGHLLFSNGVSSLPMLAVWGNKTQTCEARPYLDENAVEQIGIDIPYNDPYFGENLFDEFHSVSTACSICRLEVLDFTVLMTCDLVSAINENDINSAITSEYGEIKFTEIQINYSEGTVDFKGGFVVTGCN